MGQARPRSSTIRLLLVDRDAAARRTLRGGLEARIARPMMIMETADADAARLMVAERAFDVIAVDLATVGGPSGFASLIERAPQITAYAFGEASSVQDAVAVVRLGAADFIEKPIEGAAFARRIERQFVETNLAEPHEFEGLICLSPIMQALSDQIARIAPSQAPVFITGETGSGKSLLAKAVHARSRRRTAPFVTIDCLGQTAEALVRDLTLPGGALERADGGTLFLDEVGYMPEPAQVALARFLDTSELSGLDRALRVSVRVIACTNRTTAELCGPSGLRQDLYFRLNVLTLAAPSLRERAADLPLLIDQLLRQANRDVGSRFTRLHATAVQSLTTHAWPGNVRELKNVIELLVTKYDGDMIDADMVAPIVGDVRPAPAPEEAAPASKAMTQIRPLWMEEARIIEQAIAAFDGNIAKAAAALEISPSTIYRKRQASLDAIARVVA